MKFQVNVTLLASLVCVLTLCSTTSGLAEQLRVLTSMPPRFYQPFVDQFSERHLEMEVVVLNKNTNAAVDELLRGNDRHFDVFWSSSPEAFELLTEHGLVADGPGGSTGSHINPFALSALGWVEKNSAIQAESDNWDRLLSAELSGRVAMARPSRSGSAHMVLERFLQVRGWDDGWSYLLELGGNLSTLTARSFTVLDGVASGRFDVGVTIDFLAHSQRSNDLHFTYGTPVMITAAQIAVLGGGQAPDAAGKFVEFVVSEDGQRLLMDPSVARTPISRKVRAEKDHSWHRIIDEAQVVPWLTYDAALASGRYWAVNTLFDVFVYEQFERRKDAWRRLHLLEDGSTQQSDPALAARIRDRLKRMPVPELEVGGEGKVTHSGTFTTLSPVQERKVTEWRILADELLSEVEGLLNGADADHGAGD